MKQEVQWYLVEQLSLARGVAGLRDIAERRAGILAHFGGSLEAFRYLEAMSHDEVNDWYQRMLVALGIAIPEPPPPGASQAIWVGEGDPPRLPLFASSQQFVRQVLGPDREFELCGGRLRVFAVEVYDTRTVVRWRVAPEPDVTAVFPAESAALERDIEGLDDWAANELRMKAQAQLGMMQLYSFSLADDVGTEYRHVGGNHGGGGGEMSGRANFEPSPPETASRLSLGWHGVSAHIPLGPEPGHLVAG